MTNTLMTKRKEHLGRMFGELFFRIDPAITIAGLRLNFYVATALVLASGALLAGTQRGPHGYAVVEGARAP